MDKMVGQCYVGFNEIGSGAANAEMNEVAQNMVSAGAGSAFDSVSMRLADVTSLGGKKKDEEGESDDDDELFDGAAGGLEGSPNGKRKADDADRSPPAKKSNGSTWVKRSILPSGAFERPTPPRKANTKTSWPRPRQPFRV